MQGIQNLLQSVLYVVSRAFESQNHKRAVVLEMLDTCLTRCLFLVCICMHVIFDLVVEVTIMVAAFGVVGVGADEGEGVVK